MIKKDPALSQIYLVGSGLSSLASAVFLIRDCGVPGENIRLLEQDPVAGGCLDGAGNDADGFVTRGGRMHEQHFQCYWDLLSSIPSATDEQKSVTEETFAFNKKLVSNAQSRLIRDTCIIDVSSFGLRLRHKLQMLWLVLCPEDWIGKKRIDEWFSRSFFETKFWLIWATMFAFQEWSSAVEMKRYFQRFMHLVSGLQRLGGVMRTVYNQYDSVVWPIRKWLEARGVRFDLNTRVLDFDFDITYNRKAITGIRCTTGGEETRIAVADGDCVFITNGSIVDSSDTGSLSQAAIEKSKETSGAWMLWEKIATRDPAFGNPGVFSDRIDLQKWTSFTVTLKDAAFFEHLREKYGYTPGVSGLMTFTDSNWMLSIVAAAQPHFANQSADAQVFWGYGLYANTIGNFVKKTMPECTGAEILTELFSHMKISEMMEPIVSAGKVECKPVNMPFIDSLFMPRDKGDRPKVIPDGAINFAFLGQFCEIPKDCVFTVEYSTRSAMIAAYHYFESSKEVPPVYIGGRHFSAIFQALIALNR